MRKISSIIAIITAIAALGASCASAPAPVASSSKDDSYAYSGAATDSAPRPASAPAPASGAASESTAKPSASKDEPDGVFAEKELLPSSLGAKDSALEKTGAAAPAPAASGRAAPSSSGLRAGFSDDNEQFNYYLGFLEKYSHVTHYPLAISERIMLRVVDADGKAVHNASISVLGQSGRELTSGLSYADGSFYLFPLEYAEAQSYEVQVSALGTEKLFSVDRSGPREVELKLDRARIVKEPLPLDLLFIMDTTGSMGEEIARLKATIEIIYDNISAVKPRPYVRLGMVLYKDRGERTYHTQIVPFTDDLDAFQKALSGVKAQGGGDAPEDLQQALYDAMKGLSWNADGIRIAFIITDEEAHLDYGQTYTYASASRDAKAKAIKIHSIGTGGLPLAGEYVLRQIAQYTQGRYIFLTYGERGEAEGGKPGSVSHHTGANYETDKLESIIIRFVREDLSQLTDVPLEKPDDFFDAKKIEDEERDITLGKLFAQALQNLNDYSTLKLGPSSKVAIVPFVPAEGSSGAEREELARQAEYFTARMDLAAAEARLYTLVERANLNKLMEEIELQLSGLTQEEGAAKLGALLNAEVLVTGTVYKKADRYEVLLKLLRVETAEVLSVARAKIDRDLAPAR
jgi:Mg-chelatase subunit ChlD